MIRHLIGRANDSSNRDQSSGTGSMGRQKQPCQPQPRLAAEHRGDRLALRQVLAVGAQFSAVGGCGLAGNFGVERGTTTSRRRWPRPRCSPRSAPPSRARPCSPTASLAAPSSPTSRAPIQPSCSPPGCGPTRGSAKIMGRCAPSGVPFDPRCYAAVDNSKKWLGRQDRGDFAPVFSVEIHTVNSPR
jgi:hypothetical protein